MCENGGFSFSGSHLLEACQEIIFGDLSKKANKQVKEKLVILQSKVIIIIKSKESRLNTIVSLLFMAMISIDSKVTYTCVIII